MKYRIGIDLGGTNIKAGVVDEDYRIVGTAHCKTAMPRPAEAILSDMARMAREAVEKAGLTMDDVLSVGVGSPGTANPVSGVVEYSCNLDFEKVPVCAELEKLLSKPVYLENDANAAAFGEALAGAAKGSKSCVCITLGTGVGGGIIIDGKIYGGFNFAGAELGHIVIMVDGEPCACGRRGCWESYASATALVRQTRRAMEENPDSKMWEIADPVAREVVKKYIQYIACGLVNVINIFQPEVLCIGGGICKEGDALLRPIEEYIKAERYSKFSLNQTRLCVATLGNDAGIIGAAFLDRSGVKERKLEA